jgi:hypothetical protein
MATRSITLTGYQRHQAHRSSTNNFKLHRALYACFACVQANLAERTQISLACS